MGRVELFQGPTGSYLPSASLTDPSQPRSFTGAADASTVVGSVLQPGDRWHKTAKPPGYPVPAFDQRPMVKFTEVYRPGDTLSDVLGQRLPAVGCYLQLPDGFDGELVDFTQRGVYGAYAPLCYGLYASGPTQARVHQRRNSMGAAAQAQVPPQFNPDGSSAHGINPLWALRLGPGDASTRPRITVYGVTFVGHDQPIDPRTGLPFDWNGFDCYDWGAGSSIVNCKFQGFGQGSWNSPRGETNMLSSYNGDEVNVIACEASGINGDGTQAGAAFSANGTGRVFWQDVSVHDTFVSGATFSVTGSQANQCGSVETHNLKVAHNANHTRAPGRTFGGINHEGVANSIRHYYPDIFIDNQSLVQKEHVAINNGYTNCPDVQIIEPTWHPETGGAPPWSNGCFAVQVLSSYNGAANKQTTLPTVVKNGVVLTPVDRSAASTADPTRNYVLTRIST